MELTTIKTHNFNDSNEKSKLPFNTWVSIYSQLFPNYAGMVRLDVVDGKPVPRAQRHGVDCVIVLTDGRVIRIEEKVDSYDTENVFLEYMSVDRTGDVGWMAKSTLLTDYFVFVFKNKPGMPVHAFAAPILQQAWNRHGDRWKRRYERNAVDNGSYKTRGVPVPIEEVRLAYWEAMCPCADPEARRVYLANLEARACI